MVEHATLKTNSTAEHFWLTRCDDVLKLTLDLFQGTRNMHLLVLMLVMVLVLALVLLFVLVALALMKETHLELASVLLEETPTFVRLISKKL